MTSENIFFSLYLSFIFISFIYFLYNTGFFQELFGIFKNWYMKQKMVSKIKDFLAYIFYTLGFNTLPEPEIFIKIEGQDIQRFITLYDVYINNRAVTNQYSLWEFLRKYTVTGKERFLAQNKNCTLSDIDVSIDISDITEPKLKFKLKN